MKNISRLKWDRNNTEHISRHRVSPIEVEQVIFDEKALIRSGRDNSHYVLGKTLAGRFLFIVVMITRRLGEAVVITARDMTEKEQRYYKRRGK